MAAPFNLRLSHLVAVLLGLALSISLCLPAPPQVKAKLAGSLQPRLIDLSGSLQFGPGSDALGAMLIYNGAGRVVGRYVDDQIPEQGAVIDKEWSQGISFIVAGIAPGTPWVRYAHALNAQEWYPYNSGYPASDWGRIPRARAYILQWWFSFAGTPPTGRERMTLLWQARRRHPMLILVY